MKIRETTRKDGLRIITVSLPHKRKVYVELVARVGSAYDPPHKQGLFHLFEHMAFKGTKSRSAEDIQSFSNRNIFGLNAVTGELGTMYHGVSVHTKFEEICNLLCDIYCNSIFPEKELKKERQPVLLELARIEDNDGNIAGDALREHLWKNNPLRLSAVGTRQGVKAVTRADLLREKKRWHIPAATVAIAIGKIEHADFVKEISKRIPLNYAKPQFKTWSDEYNEIPDERRAVLKRPGRKKAIVMVGFKLPLTMSERAQVCMVSCLTGLLVTDTKSRLWQEIREKRGLAYTVGGYVHTSVGLARDFTAYAETAPEHVVEVERLMRKALLEPLADIHAFEEMRGRELDRLIVGFDDSFSAYEESIWQKVIEGKPVSTITRHFADRRRILSSLSLKEVENVRKEFFRSERFVTVVVEPG